MPSRFCGVTPIRYNARVIDTSPAAEEQYFSSLRALGIEGRARLTDQLCANLHGIIADGVRHRHPDYDEATVRIAVARIRLGEALFREVYPGRDIEP